MTHPIGNAERRICRKCGYGFYWPPIMGLGDTVRHGDRCMRCDHRGGNSEDEPVNGCTEEDMLEISS